MKQKLRIVHCFRSPVGGIFRHVRDLCAKQVAAGHDVGIVCDSSTGGTFEADLFNAIEGQLALGVVRIPMQREIGLGDLPTARKAYAAIKRMRPDVLHGHGAKGGVYARLLGTVMRGRKHRPARIYSPHGGSLHYDAETMKGQIYFRLERLMDRFCDHLLFVSDYERRTYEQKVGTPRSSNTLVYNGLNDSEFVPVKAAPDAADFLYIGMMRDLKGPDLFIDALALAQEHLDRELTAVMIGDGDDRNDYIQQARQLGFGERITFLPAMPARKAFSLARFIVVPSRAEAMPYIVLEALAAGRPMIASAVGGIPEVFGDRSPALTQPDAKEIAGKMMTALDDEAAYQNVMPSKQKLKSLFGADVMAKNIEEAYITHLL